MTTHPKLTQSFRILKPFKSFKLKSEYRVVGFGKDVLEGKPAYYKEILPIRSNEPNFKVLDTTLQYLTDNGYLIAIPNNT